MAYDARAVALKGLIAFRRENTWPDAFLKQQISRNTDRRDAALTTQILYGVLQNLRLCDFYISHYSKYSLNKMMPVVLDILRIGMYQLVFLDKIPQNAVVNEAVKMARKYGNSKVSGFVNALLRKVADSKDELPEPPSEDMVSYLSIRYSHPEWMVRRFIDSLGLEETKNMLAANNEVPPITCRVNTCLTDMDQVLESLHSDGIDATPHETLSNCLILDNPGSIESLSAYQNGLVYIQDAASQICVGVLSPLPSSMVIDVCAAPGGKSFLAAQLMGCKGQVLACDIYPHKVELIANGAKRLKLGNIIPLVSDASQDNPDWGETADFMICDVPCSGLGIIRKKPDIRFKTEEEVTVFPEMQGKILKTSANYLKHGGVMVYSTCTVLPEENERVVEAFLSGHPEFALEPFILPGSGQKCGGMITLLPHKNGTDGFFIAKIRRK